MQPTGVLEYTGTDHDCSTNWGQCYWTDLLKAQEQCGMWLDCRYLWQTEKHAPATPGHPVYWARGSAETSDDEYDEDGVLWKQTGNINYR